MEEIIVLNTHRLRRGDTIVQKRPDRSFVVETIIAGSMHYRGFVAPVFWIKGSDTVPDRAATREIQIVATGRAPWYVKVGTGGDS